MNLSKQTIYPTLVAVFTGCLLVANVIATKTFTVLSITLPAAVIIFPVVYIANDVLTEIYGFKKARQAVLIGFILNVVAVLAYSAAIALPPSPFYEAQAAFTATLSSSARVLVASFVAYLAGSLLNAFVMHRMRRGRFLFARCVLSTAIGETVDAALFISIAFFGLMPLEALLIMLASQAVVKTVYEIVVYPATKAVITWFKKLPESNAESATVAQ